VLTQAQVQTEGHSRETCVCHSAHIRHNNDAGLPSGGHHRIPSPQVLWHHGKVSAKKGKEKKRRKHTFVFVYIVRALCVLCVDKLKSVSQCSTCRNHVTQVQHSMFD
jgi:hypothetical protein